MKMAEGKKQHISASQARSKQNIIYDYLPYNTFNEFDDDEAAATSNHVISILYMCVNRQSAIVVHGHMNC